MNIKNINIKKYQHAINLIKSKKYDETISNLKSFIKEDSNDYYAHQLIALVYMDSKNFYKAIDHLNISTNINPNNPGAYYNLGVIYRTLKKFNKSQEFFLKTIEKDPNFIDAYLNRGNTKLKLEDYCYQFADDYYIEDNWIYANNIINLFPESYSLRKLYNGINIEFIDNNYFYFFYVKNYINEGNISPLEMVRNQIQSTIINKRKINFLKNVEMDLYKNALANSHVKYEKK